MFGSRDGVYKDIMDRAFALAVQEAVKEVIAHHAGGGIDSEVKDAIRAEAKRMVVEDPEIQKLIRERLLYWIAKQ
jgi:hypothetical protein